jgi:predicted RNA-binding Zn ribbon-like protein
VIEDAPGEADHPAVALANTRHRTGDELADTVAAADWLRRRGHPVRLDQAALARLVALRGAVRDVLLAPGTGTAPAPGAVTLINDAVRAAPGADLLVWDADGPRSRYESAAGSPLTGLLGAFAADAVALLVGPDADRLAECGAPGCVRLLVRTHGRRQWCSTRCGDRVRAARHYARTRGAAPAGP